MFTMSAAAAASEMRLSGATLRVWCSASSALIVIFSRSLNCKYSEVHVTELFQATVAV
jgi:hypothetical protein